MENPIIVPFDLNTARKIKSGEIEGSVLIGNIKIEFVYESKDCADRYNLLFVKKDESGISAIYADTENNDLVGIFERYKDIADGDLEVAMNFIKEAYPFNEETEVFIRKKFDMSIPVPIPDELK